MKRFRTIGLALASFTLLAPRGVSAKGHHGDTVLTADMLGGHEVPPINTPATGHFRATIHADGSIEFTLTYSNLSATPTVSHIHFGQFNVAGGVMIFLCGGGGQPACPTTTSGSFSGSIVAANVVGPATQGVTAGDLASALRIVVDQEEGYANLHSTAFPGGEVRGQVRVSHRDHDHDDD
jgi:CHRD domain-containing protein